MKARTWKPGRAALSLVWASAALLPAGCAPETPTEVVAGVMTQMRVPKDIKGVGVLVQRGSEIKACEFYPAYEEADGERSVRLPGTIGAEPREAKSEEPLSGESLTVTFYAFATDQPSFADDCVVRLDPKNVPEHDEEVRVVRRRRTTYSESRIAYLPMPLKESCAEVFCDEGQTCVGGGCVDEFVDPKTLPDYRPELVFGDSNTCFDLERCFDKQPRLAAAPDPSKPEVDTDGDGAPDRLCSFRLAVPEGATLVPGTTNVVVTYSTFGIEVLDHEAELAEGFRVPDPADPTRFELAPGLCRLLDPPEGHKGSRIVGVEGSYSVEGSPVFCPSKTLYQPICDGQRLEVHEGRVGEVPESAGLCSVATFTLSATESALYVLMDHGESMGNVYSDKALQFALETQLGNPLAHNTRIAFDYLVPDDEELPTKVNECSAANPTSSYDDVGTAESPGTDAELPFTPVEHAREKIASLVGEQAVLEENGPLYLEGVLRLDNAYEALTALEPVKGDGKGRFNRKAIAILSNREFGASCPTPGALGSPAAAAAEAFDAENLYTYAVALAPPEGTPSSEVEKLLAEASALAQSGGTELKDATTQQKGAEAFQALVNELGSCLYDMPGDDAVAALFEGPGAGGLHLSFYDPVTETRHDIEPNPACVSAESDDPSKPEAERVHGWGVDTAGSPTAIRICGSPCEDLRATLKNVSTNALVANLPPGSEIPDEPVPIPEVPILVSAPCK